ncbi:hypothetical protein FRC08_005806 [Ceratobasidium sp. 394]|nr:hypothetical protein FRC08_005806 [Ceratobasidium sp. 394]
MSPTGRRIAAACLTISWPHSPASFAVPSTNRVAMSAPQGASNNTTISPQPAPLAAPGSSLTGSLYGHLIPSDNTAAAAPPPPPFSPLNSSLKGFEQVLSALDNDEGEQ